MSDRARSFDTIEELFAYMRSNEETANKHLADEQKALSWGSYFAVFQPQDQLVIFGYCLSEAEFIDSEREAMLRQGDNPDTDLEAKAEFDESIATVRDSHERGYLFGWHYSVIEPTGELGSTHRLNAWPISKELFAAAKEAEWQPVLIPMNRLAELDRAWQAMRTAAAERKPDA